MNTRFKIIRASDGVEVRDLAARQAFRLDGTHYPADWLTRGGTIAGHTAEGYDIPPPAPPANWNVPLTTFLDRLSDVDADAVMTFIEARPAKLRERLRLRGVPNDHPAVRNWLTSKGYDPDVELSR